MQYLQNRIALKNTTDDAATGYIIFSMFSTATVILCYKLYFFRQNNLTFTYDIIAQSHTISYISYNLVGVDLTITHSKLSNKTIVDTIIILYSRAVNVLQINSFSSDLIAQIFGMTMAQNFENNKLKIRIQPVYLMDY